MKLTKYLRLGKKMTFSELKKSISSKEKWLIVFVSLAIIIVTTIPFLYAWANTPEDTTFIGSQLRGPGDTFVYYSMIEEAKQGNLFLHNLYTSESQEILQLRPFWGSLGWLAKITNLSTLVIMQIVRIALIFLSVFFIYLVVSFFVKNKTTRTLAIITSTFFSGLGWFYIKFIDSSGVPNLLNIDIEILPADLWLTDSYPILAFSSSPHFQASLILYLICVLFFGLGITNNSLKYQFISGLSLLALVFIHPYIAVFFFLFSLIAGYAMIFFWYEKKARLKPVIKKAFLFSLPALISLPGIIYQIYIYINEGALKGWAHQNSTLSPNIIFYLLGIGLLLIPIIFGFIKSCQKITEKKLFLLLWIGSIFIACYLPISFNRRFAEGYFVPLGILAGIGIYSFYKKNISHLKKPALIIIIFTFLALALLPTNIYLLLSSAKLPTQMPKEMYNIHNDEIEAFAWIKNNTQEESIVLSGQISGFAIPAFSARKVYLGHNSQTINFKEKLKELKLFFSSDWGKNQRETWLKQKNISYIYIGPKEKEFISFEPTNELYLEKRFQNDTASVFEVK